MKKYFPYSLIAVVLAVVLALVVPALATVSTTTVYNAGTYTELYNCTFGADSDQLCTISHTLGTTPDEYTVTPLDANCAVVANSSGEDYNSAMPWVNSTSSTSVGIAKASVTGSATCTVRVLLRRTHSVIK